MIPWYLVKYYVQRHLFFATSCAALLVANVLFLNVSHLFLVVWALVAGIILGCTILSSETIVPNLLPMFTRKLKDAEHDELALMKAVCTVCGLRKCPRHRPELNILAFQPWTNLFIRQRVDGALDELLTIILKEHVYSWWRDLSEDEEFVDELRISFRFLASVMFRRMEKVDVPKFVTQKILHATVQHIDLCVQALSKAPHDGDLQQIVLESMGARIHCAMWSRKAELEYLRRLVESLFPYILRPQTLNSKSFCALVREILAGSALLPTMDAVANPDLLNNLLLVFFDNTPPPAATEPVSPRVPLLSQFSLNRTQNQSCLHLQLKDVIDPACPDLLYPFMQFLKSEAAVNVLQFCLACDDFNRRILSPDVSQSEFVQLHTTVRDLYKLYCAPSAPDRIKFDDDIVEALREVVEGPPDQVIRLRTSTPLFRAYEHAYDLLENNFLPMFHQSDDYYNMICGGRPNSDYYRQMNNVFGWKTNSLSFYNKLVDKCMQPKKKDFALTQLSSKMKEVFKSADEKLGNNIESGQDSFSLNSNVPSISIEEDLEDSEGICDHSLHDLSSWRVTIPRIGARPDPENLRKQFYVFIIDVRRLDVKEGESEKTQWTVARQYREFYVLEQKLKEFHGEFMDCQLPPKKAFGTRNQEFTENRKLDFENYLQKLLTKPQLKNSELLYSFLTSEHEFATSLLPDIKLGKFVKSRLVKEKGQHLDEFLTNLAASAESTKPRPSKISRRGSETSLLSTSSEKLSGTHFENNMNLGFSPPCTLTDLPRVKDIDGVFDTLIYLVEDVYNAPSWVNQLMLSARILFKDTVENYMTFHLDNKLDQLTQEHRLVDLIYLLRDVLFFDNDPPRNHQDKKDRYNKALQEFVNFLPLVFVKVLGEEKAFLGCEHLLQIFQMPKLNKQLSYVLLDIVVLELFPELMSP